MNASKISSLDTQTLQTQLAQAVDTHPQCRPGLLATHRVVSTACGPSGDVELLARVHVGALGRGHWYAHVARLPVPAPETSKTEKKTVNTAPPYPFTALICHSNIVYDAPEVNLLFQRHYYWMRDRVYYTVPKAGHRDQLCRSATSFAQAVQALAAMLRTFHPDHHLGEPEGGEFWDTRVQALYGTTVTVIDGAPLAPPGTPLVWEAEP